MSLSEDLDRLSVKDKNALSRTRPAEIKIMKEEDNLPNEKREGVSSEASEQLPKVGISGGQVKTIELPKYEKDEDSENLITTALRSNPFLKENLKENEKIKAVVDAMYLKNMAEGSYVVTEGEPASHLYVCAKGTFDVIQNGKKVNTLGPGKVFGEIALLYNSKRNASVIATSACSLWVLDRKIFHQIMKQSGLQRVEDNVRYLKSVPLLKGLPDDILKRMTDLLSAKFYPAGTAIVRQGDEGDIFYIISSGRVTVSVTDRDGSEKIIKTLQKGEYFGEMAVLKNEKRIATVTALPPGVECLLLDRISFIELLGDLEEIKRTIQIRRPITLSELPDSKSEYDYISLKDGDLDVIGTMGQGAYGKVQLVQYKKNKNLVFALKSLKKVHVVQLEQQTHVFNEKNIMIQCNSPFIARLYKTFKDSKYLYFLMEVCLGGDLWSWLQKRKSFDEITSQFMAGCVILALEYLHSRNYVYRDLKPENLLLDAKGYVKLVDFGFAKKVESTDKTWTFVGTPEYLAPEVILNKGHDRAVDYWSLGILIHEFLLGRPPFKGKDHMHVYNLILQGIDRIIFPPIISKPAQLLIKKLCKQIPAERLGYLKEGIEGIKGHRWFANFNWESLANTTMRAPIIPKIKGPTDLSHFDSFPKDREIPPDDLTGWDATF